MRIPIARQPRRAGAVARSIELEDAVVVDREEDGRVKLHQIHRPAAAGAAGGALWGRLIGLGGAQSSGSIASDRSV